MTIAIDVPDTPLPTLDRLNTSLASDLDALKIAKDWFSTFSSFINAGDAQGIANIILPDGFWRDMLALTWDFRTFSGKSPILQFLTDRLPSAHIHHLRLRDQTVLFQQPFPDLAWISMMFDFETDVGLGSGIIRIVPTANGEWKAHVIYTNLEDLKGFPEKIGELRNANANHGLWEGQRQKEVEFADTNPVVIVIGGGHSGLDIAARLKVLDIPTLVIERNDRIGDNWRNRYDALCLHDPVGYDHMPYLPFPSTWPLYSPARKLANWLEHYADSLELNVWTSSTVTQARPVDGNKWNVAINRNGVDRSFVVNHIIFATGIGSGVPNTPSYPDMDKFKGLILHSSEHKKATDHLGKKVVVVGSCTSAHDIAVDYYNHGVDVTMYQRGSTYVMSTLNGWKVLFGGVYIGNTPPLDVADRLSASFPHHMSVGLNQRRSKIIAEMDRDILDALEKRGFRLNYGIKGTGFSLLAWSKAGGYYLDVGGSKLVAEGKIKLKNDSLISNFTETGLKFENGSELPADVVVFATGLGETRDQIRRVCGNEVGDRCKPIWGLNREGEINGAWRDLGIPGLWYMIGNLALSRFHSKHVALQIKAIEEGLFGTRYSLNEQ